MLTKTFRSRLLWSAALISVVLLVAFATKEEEQPSQIYGAPSEYSLTMDASNSPTLSSNYTDVFKTIRYTQFHFLDVKASPGNFIELNAYGYFLNTDSSQITSITSITATYQSESTLWFWVGKTPTDAGFYDSLVSGVRYNLPSLPYFVDFWTQEYTVVIQSLTITYTCVPS